MKHKLAKLLALLLAAALVLVVLLRDLLKRCCLAVRSIFNDTIKLDGLVFCWSLITTFKELRREAAKYVADKGADGNAIGGLAVGEPTEVMYEMIEVVNEILPKDKPRYLMGVGTPQNILEAIERGVDMFDCVMPTRNGRNAMLFTYEGTMNMRNKKWEADFSPIDPDGCNVDRIYTKAYLHHLFKAQELLAMQIASIHNLAFYLRLVTDARQHIEQGDFTKWKASIIDQLGVRR